MEFFKIFANYAFLPPVKDVGARIRFFANPTQLIYRQILAPTFGVVHHFVCHVRHEHSLIVGTSDKHNVAREVVASRILKGI